MSRSSFNIENLIVRAGAGAGKTTELTERVLGIAGDFYLSYQRYPRLVVTTFTRKATQELRERLLKKALESGDSGILDFVKRPHLLHISTIHGVLSLFLQQFGSRIQLSPDIRFISQRDSFRELKRITRRLAEHDETFAMALENCLEIFSLSDFLSEVEQFGEDSLTKNVRGAFSRPEFGTAIQNEKVALLRISKELASQIAQEPVNEAWKSLGSLVSSLTLQSDFLAVYQACPSVRKSKSTSETLIELKDQFYEFIEKCISYSRSSEFLDLHEKMVADFDFCASQIYQESLRTKIKSGEITMSDLEILAALVIRQAETDEGPSPAKIFSERWDYWLIDEYQDTSPLQVFLIDQLKGDRKEFVVGDPQQSIYLFRGARSEVFSAKEDLFRKKDGKIASKLRNYRSDPELLVFFNDIFTQMAAKGSHQFGKMEPKSDVFDPHKKVAMIYYFSSDQVAASENPVSDDLRAMVERCLELFRGGVSLEKICILFRSHRAIEEFVSYANQVQLPIQVHSSGQFGQRPEVIDLNCLLQFLLNPLHNTNLIQLLRMPGFRISDSQIVERLQQNKSAFFWSQIKQIGGPLFEPVIEKLNSALDSRHRLGLSQALVKLIQDFHFFEQCHKDDPSGFREANVWKYLQMLQESEKIPGFSYKNFIENLSSLSSMSEESSEQVAVPVVAPAKVNLMTIHASKGLQFEHIILPNIGKALRGDTGSQWMREEPLDIEQEIRWTLAIPEPDTGVLKKSLFGEQILKEKNQRSRMEDERVFYVALTRAIQTVTLVAAGRVDSESWLGRLDLNLTEGLHAEKFYSYEVRSHLSSQQDLTIFSKQALNILPRQALESQKTTAQKSSVTSILEDLSGKESSAEFQKTQMADVSKAVLGTRVHRALENIKYYLMKNESGDLDQWLKLTPEDLHQPIQYLQRNTEGPWLEIIKNGEVEFGFAAKVEGRLIQGQIDLWGRDEKGVAWLVDYKTGSPFFVEKAFAQLKIYLQCLRVMKKLSDHDSVNLAVIYPFDEKVFIRGSL